MKALLIAVTLFLQGNPLKWEKVGCKQNVCWYLADNGPVHFVPTIVSAYVVAYNDGYRVDGVSEWFFDCLEWNVRHSEGALYLPPGPLDIENKMLNKLCKP